MQDKIVTVMGLGRHGGGLGVTRWLVEHAGARVRLTDQSEASALAESLAQLEDHVQSERIELRLGGHEISDFTNVDLVVANPAVPRPWSNEFLCAAQAAGVPVTTEIRLVFERIPESAIIVGITGTAGKSTTTAMIHHILRHCEIDAGIGGNFGGSLLSVIEEDILAGRRDRVNVLELSSAMLYWLGAGVGAPSHQAWAPHVAVLTNIAPNHLDWHETFEHYCDCKFNIFQSQPEPAAAVRGDTISEDTQRLAESITLSIPGRHNRLNGALAVQACLSACDVSEQQCIEALRSFRSLPHRLEIVAEWNGCRFINDSKATTPESTKTAIESFDESERIHLIAGGYDKKIDLEPLAQLSSRVAGMYAIGEVGEQIVRLAGSASVIDCETLSRAVDAAFERMNSGDVLLLSPGCASWDQFASFEERGDQFASLVRQKIGQPDAEQAGMVTRPK